MHASDTPTVLIVRGAGPSGRRLATRLQQIGVTPVVLDERTCAHDGVHAARVPFREAAAPRRAVRELAARHGAFAAVVLLPRPAHASGAESGASWELELGHELTVVAGLVRTAAPLLAESSGVLVPVSSSGQHRAATHPVSLSARASRPVIEALAEEFDVRLAPVVTTATGTARGNEVADVVIDRAFDARRPRDRAPIAMPQARTA